MANNWQLSPLGKELVRGDTTLGALITADSVVVIAAPDQYTSNSLPHGMSFVFIRGHPICVQLIK